MQNNGMTCYGTISVFCYQRQSFAGYVVDGAGRTGGKFGFARTGASGTEGVVGELVGAY